MASKLTEICDICKKEYPQSADIQHLRHMELIRYVVIVPLHTAKDNVAMHVEVCKECNPSFIEKLRVLFLGK